MQKGILSERTEDTPVLDRPGIVLKMRPKAGNEKKVFWIFLNLILNLTFIHTSMNSLRVPRNGFFSFVNRKKSQEVKYGENGG